jgi:hypothetical protein
MTDDYIKIPSYEEIQNKNLSFHFAKLLANLRTSEVFWWVNEGIISLR